MSSLVHWSTLPWWLWVLWPLEIIACLYLLPAACGLYNPCFCLCPRDERGREEV